MRNNRLKEIRALQRDGTIPDGTQSFQGDGNSSSPGAIIGFTTEARAPDAPQESTSEAAQPLAAAIDR